MCRPVDTEDTKLTQIICLNRCNFHVLCAANAKKKRKEEKKDDTDAVTRRRTSEQREGGAWQAVYAGKEDISWYPDGHNSRRRQLFPCRLASGQP